MTSSAVTHSDGIKLPSRRPTQLKYRTTPSRYLWQAAKNVQSPLQTQVGHGRVRGAGIGSETQRSDRSGSGICVFDPPSSASPATLHKIRHKQIKWTKSSVLSYTTTGLKCATRQCDFRFDVSLVLVLVFQLFFSFSFVLVLQYFSF